MYIWYTDNGWKYVYTYSPGFERFDWGRASECYWLVPGTEN